MVQAGTQELGGAHASEVPGLRLILLFGNNKLHSLQVLEVGSPGGS